MDSLGIDQSIVNNINGIANGKALVLHFRMNIPKHTKAIPKYTKAIQTGGGV
jgi:hypothetical protein